MFVLGFLLSACVVWIFWLPETIRERDLLPNGDHLIQYRWWLQFDTALREGVWSPKWAHAAHGGLGEPAFLYYQPLFFYITSAFGVVLSPTNAIRAAVWFPYALTGAIAFARIRSEATFSRAAVVMVIIVTCPALFFLSTHVGAFPWVMAMPFCLLFALESTNDKPDFAKISLWLCLVCLSHLLSGLMSLVCVGVARLAFAFSSRGALRGNVEWLGGIVLGLLLAAFFIYPAVSQQSFVNPSGWTSNPSLDWHRGFAFPVFSYFKYGHRWFLWQWPIPVFTALMCALVFWIAKRFDRSMKAPQVVVASRLAIIALAGLIFSSELAYPLFALLPPLQKLQFPYRFVFPAMLLATMALCTACMAHLFQHNGRNRVNYCCALAAAAQCVVVILLHYNMVGFGKAMPDLRTVLQGEFGQVEYLTAQRGPHSDQYKANGGLAGECARLTIVCREIATNSHASAVSITADRAISIRLPRFSFPGWRVSVDGTEQSIAPDLDTGLLLVTLPSGRHIVATRWGGTPPEPTARLISLAASACLLAVFLSRIFMRRRLESGRWSRTSAERVIG
jgi:hypothetical protein